MVPKSLICIKGGDFRGDCWRKAIVDEDMAELPALLQYLDVDRLARPVPWMLF